MENHYFEWENSLFLWPFPIATLNYQRVISYAASTCDKRGHFGVISIRGGLVYSKDRVFFLERLFFFFFSERCMYYNPFNKSYMEQTKITVKGWQSIWVPAFDTHQTAEPATCVLVEVHWGCWPCVVAKGAPLYVHYISHGR